MAMHTLAARKDNRNRLCGCDIVETFLWMHSDRTTPLRGHDEFQLQSVARLSHKPSSLSEVPEVRRVGNTSCTEIPVEARQRTNAIGIRQQRKLCHP